MKAYIITYRDNPTIENSTGKFYPNKQLAELELKWVKNNIIRKTGWTIAEVEITPVVSWLED